MECRGGNERVHGYQIRHGTSNGATCVIDNMQLLMSPMAPSACEQCQLCSYGQPGHASPTANEWRPHAAGGDRLSTREWQPSSPIKDGANMASRRLCDENGLIAATSRGGQHKRSQDQLLVYSSCLPSNQNASASDANEITVCASTALNKSSYASTDENADQHAQLPEVSARQCNLGIGKEGPSVRADHGSTGIGRGEDASNHGDDNGHPSPKRRCSHDSPQKKMANDELNDLVKVCGRSKRPCRTRY